MQVIRGNTASIMDEAARIVDAVRELNPLVDCVTNYITANDCANILLAFGASPAMLDVASEAYAFARISGALYLNFGTYIRDQEAAAVEAILGAKAAKRPVVVDPVGCGAIRGRIGILAHLHEIGGIDIIKGNAGEILSLAGKDARVKGVDSGGESKGLEEAVTALARQYRCVIAATEKTDLVGDGQSLVRISNGVDMLTRITGAGCMAGALCGAAAAAAAQTGSSMLAAAVAALAAMGIAGELAYETARLPGSFRTALIDRIYALTGDMLKQKGKGEVCGVSPRLDPSTRCAGQTPAPSPIPSGEIKLRDSLRLYLCTSRRSGAEAVSAAIAGGVTMVQLREKDASSREFYETAQELRALTRRLGVPLVINDRLDIALAVGADGLHIGQSDLPVKEARRLAGRSLFIGVSAGTVEEALAAEQDGADYVGAGPVYPTDSKADTGETVGIPDLAKICAAVRIPVAGIGGITEENAGEVLGARVAGIAVISAILSQPDRETAARRLRQVADMSIDVSMDIPAPKDS
jgi:hydroxyethylthiazole kinase